jgi:hypothetical protein
MEEFVYILDTRNDMWHMEYIVVWCKSVLWNIVVNSPKKTGKCYAHGYISNVDGPI